MKIKNKIRRFFGLPEQIIVQGKPLPTNIDFNVKKGKVVGMVISPATKHTDWEIPVNYKG